MRSEPLTGRRGSRLDVLRWVALAALVWVAACSKDKEIDQPAKLTDFNATIRVQKVWTASVRDKGAKPLRLGLGLAIEGNRLYAAGHKGEVAALDRNTGRTLWHAKVKAPLSAGPGVNEQLVVVGSSKGDLFAVSAADGSPRWRVQLSGEVLSSPVLSSKIVAVRTVDGKIHGLSPEDGHELWSQEQQVPRLSLRGVAKPVFAGDLVLCGFDNGKVVALNVLDGGVQWEATVAPPHGKTEIERLVDIDSAVRVSGSDVYVVGYQGRIAMLALDTGQIWWSHDASSYRDLGIDDDVLYMAEADGEVAALRGRTGAEIWRQKSLLHRRLSAAIATDDAIVTADYQGYVHWLDKATGDLAARASTGKVRISNPPVAVGNMVYVINDVGHIVAFRVTPLGGRKAIPKPAPEATGSEAPPAPGAAPPSQDTPAPSAN
ncbi:MAG TPA: outer membrane protein assembly factor BamB [Steroidobacteraceae bacterium]|nr:outer membrane protein assembly factor BamB [Steroidobacteraceae bacterium]